MPCTIGLQRGVTMTSYWLLLEFKVGSLLSDFGQQSLPQRLPQSINNEEGSFFLSPTLTDDSKVFQNRISYAPDKKSWIFSRNIRINFVFWILFEISHKREFSIKFRIFWAEICIFDVNFALSYRLGEMINWKIKRMELFILINVVPTPNMKDFEES